MKFSSQTTFNMVRKMLEDPSDSADYHILYAIIQTDCQALLRNCTLSQQDKEDIIQETQISVFSGLLRYAENFANASDAQRGAYLRTILSRRLNDMLARRYRHSSEISYDMENFPPELCSIQDCMLYDICIRSELTQTLHEACQMDCPAEQTIAFLCTKCTSTPGKNDKPSHVAQLLGGMPLKNAAQIVIDQFRQEYSFPSEWDIFAPLQKKLAQPTTFGTYGDCIFQMTPRAISNSNGKISEYLRKIHDRFFGGNSL